MARATTDSLEPGKKRKRKDEILHGGKKSRTLAVVSPKQVNFQDQALQLEEEILESRTQFNSIHTLLQFLHSKDGVEEEKIIAAVTLCRVFCKLMAGGNLNKLRQSSRDEATITQWLRERLQDYEQELLRMLRNKNIGTQSTALTVVMRLLKEKASHMNLSEGAVWQNGLFGELIQTLVKEAVAEEIRVEFVETYVEEYDDVRYYTFGRLAYVLSLG